MTIPLRVYIGYDERMEAAYRVAAKSASTFGCDVIELRESVLRKSGMLTRPVDTRGGSAWDLNSSAPQSTAFAVARFFTPILAHSGVALFVDSDVLFVRDPHELLDIFDERYAVMCVQHEYQQRDGTKMVGQKQTMYSRKNWSSVALYNASHEANHRLNLTTLNNWAGRDLHAMKWLHDDEIGRLPAEWNWLCGIQARPSNLAVAHFTEGVPNMPGYENCDGAELWHRVAAEVV